MQSKQISSMELCAKVEPDVLIGLGWSRAQTTPLETTGSTLLHRYGFEPPFTATLEWTCCTLFRFVTWIEKRAAIRSL